MNIEVVADPTREAFLNVDAQLPLNRELVADQAPDCSWIVKDPAGTPAGRCSVWWRKAPAHAQHRVGVIGHYSAVDADAACALLAAATSKLRDEGCTLAVGPMDANTWYRYRLLTERGTEPIFFLEPDNPDDWPRHFLDAGFESIARYTSAARTDLVPNEARLGELNRRAADRGVALRQIDPARFEDELERLYRLSVVGFRENLFYAPIGREAFFRLYQRVGDLIQPELVLLAEREDATVGFVFALPDLSQAQRGSSVDTAILKTLAVHPQESGWGLGTLLAEACHRAAAELGYRRMIHALMQTDNRSRRISQHTATTIRRYDLYGKRLRDAP